MHIHEYQAKDLLQACDIPTLQGEMVVSKDEALASARKMGGHLWVVKAQIHAGGRGKGIFTKPWKDNSEKKGGVCLASSPEEAAELAEYMLGNTLVTKQTESGGKQVNKVYIEKGCAGIMQEFYLSVLVDRNTSTVSFVFSPEGGMDIEKIAKDMPEKISSFAIDPAAGIRSFHGRIMAKKLGLTESGSAKECQSFLTKLYGFFLEKDCNMIEINPLVLDDKKRLICLDCKMGFDENALYRHPDIAALRDKTEENSLELEAAEHDLSYIALDGNIGCMVNGAGLAMTTMDLIKLHGAAPANFLDVGGSASEERVRKALEIILSDTKIRSVLINIFGGIMKCDLVAKGLVNAVNTLGVSIPLVIRLEGTNAEEGLAIIKKSGLNVSIAQSLSEAAETAVNIAKKSA